MSKTKEKQEETALAQAQPTALAQAEIDEMYGQETEIPNLSFGTIKISHGTAQFEVGPEDYVKTIRGHVLFVHEANQWWETAYEDRGPDDSPFPNCFSVDGVKPNGGDMLQSEWCKTCPRNQFGSCRKGTKGKDCRNTMRLLVIQEDGIVPELIAAPPTSLGKKSSLQVWLNGVINTVGSALTEAGVKVKWSNGRPCVPMWPVLVEFSLKKLEGINASALVLKTLDVITPDTPEGVERSRYLFQLSHAAIEAYKRERDQYIATEGDDRTEAGGTEVPFDDGDDTEVPI